MNVDSTKFSAGRSAGVDPALTQLLRSTYAAPSDAQYWAGLEHRVMARIRDSAPVSWWSVLPEWRAAGMIAAAAALFLGGFTAVREQQSNALARERATMAMEGNPYGRVAEPVIAISPSSGGARVRPATPERYLDLIRP